MQYNPLTIILTTLGLYVASYILITFFTFLYIGFTKHSHEIKAPKLLLATAISSLAWILSTFVGLMVAASFGLLVFSVVTLVLIFGFSYLVVKYFLNIVGKSKWLYCLLVAVIFNPGWLSLFRIL